MSVRLFKPGPSSNGDAARLDQLLNSNSSGYISLASDRVLLVDGRDGCPNGCLLWRPTAWVHELVLPGTLGITSVAARLTDMWNDAARLDLMRKHRVSQAAFAVDNSNARMLRYVRDVLRATEQVHCTTFLLDLSARKEQVADEGV